MDNLKRRSIGVHILIFVSIFLIFLVLEFAHDKNLSIHDWIMVLISTIIATVIPAIIKPLWTKRK
jgi:hypothetical protein